MPKGASSGLGGGVHGFAALLFGWKCVKNCDGLIKEHGLGGIGGGGVPTPMSCQTLGPNTLKGAEHGFQSYRSLMLETLKTRKSNGPPLSDAVH